MVLCRYGDTSSSNFNFHVKKSQQLAYNLNLKVQQ